jgi:chemotaxis protein methyltransferase CheR
LSEIIAKNQTPKTVKWLLPKNKPMAVTLEEINQFMSIVKSISPYDFTDYSDKSFARRLERILLDNRFEFPDLINKIKKDSLFLEKIVKAITVNTTELFRDPKIWHSIKYRIVPKLAEQDRINIWHAGCSTGQELYSMLILLNEADLLERTNIFGTDLNADVLEIAKKGEYKYRNNIEYMDNYRKVMIENPYNYEETYDVPHTKYFDIDKIKDTIVMKPFLVRKPVWSKHDLVNDGNIFNIEFDIIFCRNVLIYFNSRLQNHIFELFYNCLEKNGTLILGAHESMLGPITLKYRKKGKYYTKK